MIKYLKPQICGVALVGVLSLSLNGQISNPIPETIDFGDLTLELEPYVTIPASSNSAPKARLSVMRGLPDGRKFVNDLQGYLYSFEEGSATLYLDLDEEIAAFTDTPGLGTGFQSFAFHPDFATNGIFYTTHNESWNANGGKVDFRAPNAPSGGLQAVVMEWTATDSGAATFSGSSREVVRFHFGGTVHGIQEIAFNPNATSGTADYGMLYVCLGEGGTYLSGLAENEHRLDSFLGSIFRIDPLGNNSENGAYGIPTDNPWADSADSSVITELYAYGFRNPHRIIWGTGADKSMYVGDIGEKNLEEINRVVPGGDYGFPEREGTFLLDPNNPSDNDEVFALPADDAKYGYIYPVAQFDHDEGFAITLGPVYEGSAIPGLKGVFIFGDIKAGRVFYLNQSDLIDGSQATIEEARLTLSGVSGTLNSFTGNSRADIRFGTDADGEVYILTKADGKVWKIVGIGGGETGGEVDSNPDNWVLADDFEEGSTASTVVQIGSGGVVENRSDPYGDTSNVVKGLSGEGSVLRMPISITPNSSNSAVYFRFALAEAASEIEVGLSLLASATSVTEAKVTVSASGDGSLRVTEGSGTVEVADDLRTGVWYECWITFEKESNQFNLYLRGDSYSSAALLHTEGTPKSTLSSLNGLVAETSGTELAYIDDIYYDPNGINLSGAVSGSWQLVSNFESDQSLETWTFMNTNGSITPSEEDIQWLMEPSGNAYLRVAATPTSATPTIAYRALPASVEVSDIVTFYGRFRAESLDLNQNFGLSNIVASEDLRSNSYNSFEAQMRVTEAVPVDVRNSGSFEPISSAVNNTISAGDWWEYWMVVNNGGQASGGQTFDLYMRPDTSNELPVLVAETVDFRMARELPLRNFVLIAGSGTTAPGAMDYDDLYMATGIVLERPSGIGVGLFPGPVGGKESPWFGYLWDDAAPWIYHITHRWVYMPENQVGSIWYFDYDLGWMYTKPELYPYIYDASGSEWLYYQTGTIAPRWFYGFEGKTWMEIE